MGENKLSYIKEEMSQGEVNYAETYQLWRVSRPRPQGKKGMEINLSKGIKR